MINDNDINQHNQQTWNSGAYQAWVNRFGTPQEAAAKIKDNPAKRLGSLYKHFGPEIQGKRVMNLLGSNGNKAVALALLGADVTVADYSADNERYAGELAEAAGVTVRYVLADVLHLPEAEAAGQYDIVMMENGILHYFHDLQPLFRVAADLLTKGGRLVLQDFHPVSTKLISSKGTTANIRKHKVTGDYFDTSLQEKDASFSKYLGEGGDELESERKVLLRNWTLGEIVTAVAQVGLFIRTLEELPNQSSETFDKGIPKTFTVIAEKL
ncbi:class I SAM-dependent methyltransferase [Gorillibacterium massiliense]|uniref:class I SAM-dependent methyltransferase n=1 Tax=Gorillibacterium massiliense TaxID=1280390 RepID=UPI0004BA1154|nr:class I SAM-dependent methyltransferase [Gorillibacterium massiliense]